jgi:hypothetical protein
MPGKETREKIMANQFKCDLAEHVSSIRNISAFFPEMDNTDGGSRELEFSPGQPDYGQLVVRGPANKKSVDAMKQWWTDHREGKDARKQITVTILSPQKNDEVRKLDFHEAIPVSFIPPAANMATNGALTAFWEVEVNVNRIDMRATS